MTYCVTILTQPCIAGCSLMVGDKISVARLQPIPGFAPLGNRKLHRTDKVNPMASWLAPFIPSPFEGVKVAKSAVDFSVTRPANGDVGREVVVIFCVVLVSRAIAQVAHAGSWHFVVGHKPLCDLPGPHPSVAGKAVIFDQRLHCSRPGQGRSLRELVDSQFRYRREQSLNVVPDFQGLPTTLSGKSTPNTR